MPRAHFECDPTSPYHICSRSNNREVFEVPISVAWDIKSSYLHLIATAMNVKIHSFVLMNNHFHMLASFPEANLSAAMNYFMREASKAIGKEGKRINHIYGGRVFRSRISTYSHYMNVYKYVYRNPLAVGLSELVEDYEYSTLGRKLGKHHLPFPVADDTLLFDGDISETLRWLNRPIENRHAIDIKNALRHSDFRLRKSKNTNQPHELNFNLC
ncbi:MAG: transposase [Bdellovibrionaceae bacterium]|nr:transposase [Pseudobdellovibrionaceae bacterium]